MTTLEKLLQEQKNIHAKYATEGEDYKAIMAEYKAKQLEIKDFKLDAQIKAINKKHKELKAFLWELYNMGPIDSDLFCEDGNPHKTKIKRNPELEKFCLKYRAKLTDQYGHVAMYFYGTGKQFIGQITKSIGNEVMPFEDFEEMCEYHYVLFKPLTMFKVKKQIKDVLAESYSFIKKEKEYRSRLQEIGIKTLESERLIDVQTMYVKTYY